MKISHETYEKVLQSKDSIILKIEEKRRLDIINTLMQNSREEIRKVLVFV